MSHDYSDRNYAKRDLSAGTMFLHSKSQCLTSYLSLLGRSPTHWGSHYIINANERADNELHSRIATDTPEASSVFMQAPEITEETRDSSKSPMLPGASDPAPSIRPRASDRKRPPRVRNLLESVHAHLALRPRGHSPLTEPDNTTSLLPDPQAPSLLTRLSDADSDGSQLPTLVKRSDDERLISGKDTIMQNSISAPEAMARTRHARNITPASETVQSRGIDSPSLSSNIVESAPRPSLAREGEGFGTHRRCPLSAILPEWDCAPGGQTANSGTQISRVSEYINVHKARQESPTLESTSAALHPLHEPRCHVPPSILISGISVNDTIKAVSHHPSISQTSRTRLLAKLEEEKNRAHGIVAEKLFPKPSLSDTTFPGSANRLSTNQGPYADPNIVDTKFIEAKLRTRAKLQVRLAAEKKSGQA
jgi:hypothetical protein